MHQRSICGDGVDHHRGKVPIRRKNRCLLALLPSLAILCGSAHACAGTLVTFAFNDFGVFNVDLFDDLTPQSVANFLHYVDNATTGQLYNNTMLHRVDTTLGVIQGGGYRLDGSGITPLNPPIPLEYSRANTRGTIAMARTGAANTNTATSQWFINTDDNTTSLGASNAGGYAVFGWVMGTGMSVVDAMAAVPTFKFDSPFGQVPLQGYTQADFNHLPNPVDPLPHAIVLSSVHVVSTHAAFHNPVLAVDVDNSGGIEPHDALLVINDLITHGPHSIGGVFSGGNYLDVQGNGDGMVTPADALRVINALIAQANHAAQPAASSLSLSAEPAFLAAPTSVVPEPSSLALAAVAALALCGVALGRLGPRFARHRRSQAA